jgi:hypothetical protein
MISNVIDFATRRTLKTDPPPFHVWLSGIVGAKWYVVHPRCKKSRSWQGIPFPDHAALITYKEFATFEARYVALYGTAAYWGRHG